MDQDSIDSLIEALRFSPHNLPLKLHLAEVLFRAERMEEARQYFQEILETEPSHTRARKGLAKVFFHTKAYDQCNVILESLMQEQALDVEMLLLHAKALLREKMVQQATNVYKMALKQDPTLTDEELDHELRINSLLADTDDGDDEGEYEDDDDEDDEGLFIQKPSLRFEDVGGMEQVKKEIEMKIINPLKHPELYKAYGKKMGGGILLYGPPGCGKTFLARATAGQVQARFISVGLNDILDMWIGGSEKNLSHIFEVARKNAPCVLFFDEIDALGASRSDMRKSSGRHLINQFLHELDGIDNNNDGVLILGATNTPWHLDSAFRRPGRFDRIIFVPPPDAAAREGILRIKLKDRPIEEIDYQSLAKKLETYSGADLEAVIDIAVEEKLEQSFLDGKIKPLQTKDLMEAAKRHKPSTQEWFNSARNYALYANESGLYDDILKHLNIKK